MNYRIYTVLFWLVHCIFCKGQNNKINGFILDGIGERVSSSCIVNLYLLDENNNNKTYINHLSPNDQGEFAFDNFSNRFGQTIELTINHDSIASKDKTGESKINISEIEKIDETAKHFFLKLSSGHSFVIPKNEIKQVESIRQKLKDLGLTINNETNWNWK